ncbi:MAG: YfcC family protein [Pyramidobacter sp.]|jgi:uncharacterized ion transporter superfamily protein YfcC
MKNEKNVPKTNKVPHQLIIILAIAALATLATYIIPAGIYTTVNINGRKAIDASSFSYIVQTPVSPWKALLAMPQGFIRQVNIIVMVLLIAASMSVINATGVFDATIGKLASRYKHNLYLIIPVLMGCFSVLGVMGINTPIIAFIPLALILGYNLGGDALIGVSLGLLGMTCGLAGGAFCSSSTAVAQSLIGLPVFSGWELRIAATIAFWAAGSAYLVHYTRRVQSDPTASIMYNAENVIVPTSLASTQTTELSIRLKLTLTIFLVGFSVIVYGATHNWKTSDALPVIFMLTATGCGLVSGMSPNKIASEFIKGAKTVIGACIVIGFATGINIILTEGNVIHTIVHSLSSLFINTTNYVSALGIYVCNLIINIVICSSSGQATTVIPIFSGMGDVLGISQQTIVQTFNFGDAITNAITPLSGTLIASIGLAGISLDRWLRFFWKWLIINIIIGGIFVAIGVAVSYGPF